MARIAIGGFQHETNTFAPLPADLATFEKPDSWPGLNSGREMLNDVRDVHLPIAGALSIFEAAGHDILPLSWCSATPSNRVTKDAFERISTLMLDKIRDQLPVDALYLDLHGAMVCEHYEDGEGELLRRIRKILGSDIPIVVSLDLHANITDEMVSQASIIDCYREYPHTDMGETGARTAKVLLSLLNASQSQPKYHSMCKLEFQIPLNWGCTLVEPAKSVYQHMENLLDTTPDVSTLCFACGFPLADIYETGPAIVAYGKNASAVESIVKQLKNYIVSREAEFAGRLYTPQEAIERSLENTSASPMILADTQDNPGGGGASDTMGVFRALVAANAPSAVIANITDVTVAEQAHAAGVGATIQVELGEHSNGSPDPPFEGAFKVLKLSDGNCIGTGPMYLGAKIALGKTALLQHKGVRVIVNTNCQQVADRSILRLVGIEPEQEGIICLKSSVHFRNDFQQIAKEVLIVESPGPVIADPNQLEYQHIRPQLRITPHIG